MRLRRYLAIMRREFFFMWRDRGLRHILLIVPVLGFLLFMGIYNAQIMKNIPTAIVDLDKTATSEEIVDQLNHAEYLKVVAYPSTYDELKEQIEQGKIIVGVVIPENYDRDVGLHRQTRIAMIVDGTNMAFATNASTAVLTVTRTISAQAGIQTLIAGGIQPGQAQEAYQAIDFRQEAWFNPTLNYAYFIVLALALNMWQQCCTLVSCMNIIGETGVKSWLQIKISGISKFGLFFSKSIVQIAVFMILVLPILFLAFGVFKFPLQCGWLVFLLFLLVFVIALHSVGTLMSSFARTSVDATRFGMIIALPSFVISGFTWPLEAMPQGLRQAAWILPHTWFFQGINYFMFKNPGGEFIRHYFLVLGLMAVICYSLAALITSRN
jgi:ABC-2 type transport system permease protein